MRILLALLVLSPQEGSAEDLLKAVREKISKARTLRMESEWTFTAKDDDPSTSKCLVLIKGSDRWSIDVSSSSNHEGASYSAASDGRRIRLRGHGPVRAQSMTPVQVAAVLREELVTSVDTQLFVPVGSGAKPTPLPKVGPPRDRGREKIGGRDARILEYEVLMEWEENPTKETYRLFIDPAGPRPFRVEVRSEYYTWVQEIKVFAFDEEIPDSEIAIRWGPVLARARAGQLAESAGLFTLYTGRHPRSLDDLVKRPAWLEPDVFYPEAGFVLGGAIPRDPWGRLFGLTATRVISLGADGKAGGSGDDQDVSAEVPVATREAIGAPSERLRKHYSARVQLQLHAAAVRAFQACYGELPKKRAVLWEKPDGADAWPEGGWIAGTGLPNDPWGQTLRLITDEGTARVQVQDPRARRLLRRDLGKDELESLERSSRPRMTDEDARLIAKVLARCIDDDFETRVTAVREAKALGPVVVPFIEGHQRDLRDANALRWLAGLREAFPELPRAWVRELAGLAVGVGRAAPVVGEPTANERIAAASLKTLASAEADFRANDRDRNQVNDFWTGDVAGLYTLVPAGDKDPIKLIEVSVAAADAAPLNDGADLAKVAPRGPKAGYWFQAMTHCTEEGKREAYAQDTKGEKGKGRVYHTHRFAFCAFPADYGISGTRTLIIDEQNTIWGMDTGGEPVLELPSEDDLARDWKKLD
ncbi:MAG TPA: type II secretion system protein GspG [Planctomycetota bacterium]|nr:type II secretion system protein GspG [Planctomycetota bacterium]